MLACLECLECLVRLVRCHGASQALRVGVLGSGSRPRVPTVQPSQYVLYVVLCGTVHVFDVVPVAFPGPV